MRIIPGNAQHIGARREQQDDFGFSDLTDRDFVRHGGVLAVIADGMGGLAMGRDASRIAKLTMLREYEAKAPDESIPAALGRALKAANRAVLELARQAGLEGEVGTTLAAAVIRDQELYWVSVGDSRIYLYRQGELFQLTTDHDYGRELSKMAAAGQITWKEASSDTNRRALTSYLGAPQLLEVDQNAEPELMEPGDRVMLCSDGLYGSLTEAEMADLLETPPQEAAELLVEATMSKNKAHQDNLTVAILACQPAGLFDRLGSQPFIANLRGWGQNWRQLTCAALMGAMLGGSGVWLFNMYRHPGVGSAPHSITAISARDVVKPVQETSTGPAAEPLSVPAAASPGGGTETVPHATAGLPRDDTKPVATSSAKPPPEEQETVPPPKAVPPPSRQSKNKEVKRKNHKTENKPKTKKPAEKPSNPI
jgi:protein phosphatase